MKPKLNPPNYFMLFVALAIILHFIFPIIKFIGPPYRYIGILLIIFGIVLNLAVWKTFRKLKTTIETYNLPDKLATSGFFKISRNPLYLGMVLILLGESVLLGSLISFLFPVLLFILLDKIAIPAEEENLEKKFGRKYRDYKNKVRRWI